MIHNLKSGFILIVARDHMIIHRSGTRDVGGQVIRMRRSKNRNIALALCPSGGICRMGMCDTADPFPVFIEHCVGLSIRRRSQFTFDDLTIKINDHHMIRRQFLIRNPAGFNGKYSLITIRDTYITKGKKDQSQFRQLHVALIGFFFYGCITHDAKVSKKIKNYNDSKYR
ncbi:hypothetical protein FM120_15140 [Sphingobacterium faecium PCAi_F2.5]|nr:hypothetical protein FM120_15140 [Sphingobacterium faecium PCAi_F2.5]